MKFNFWFGLSVALNLLLLILFLNARSVMPTGPVPATTNAVAQKDTKKDRHLVGPAINLTMPETKPGLGQWVNALRAAGVPEAVIADVAASDFEHRWQKQMTDLQRKIGHGEADPDALDALSRQYADAQENELRLALGDEGYKQWDQKRVLDEFAMADLKLSSTEADSLYQLKKDFEQKTQKRERDRQNGDIDETEYQKQVEADQKDYNQHLKTLLGEDRYLETQNPIDAELINTRRALNTLSLNDTQSAGILQAQEQWTKQRTKLSMELEEGQLTSEEYEKQLKALDGARDETYQRLLGTNGVAEMQKAQDPRYQAMRSRADKFGLDENDVNQLYDAIHFYEKSVNDYQERARAVEQQGQPVDWPEVQKNLRDFAQKTESMLQQSLGTDRFQKLKRNNLLNLEEDGEGMD
jgi:hypothetical protein